MLGDVGYKHQVTINASHTQIHTHPLSDVVRRNSYFFVYEQYFTGKHSRRRLSALQLIFPLGLSGEFSKRPV